MKRAALLLVMIPSILLVSGAQWPVAVMLINGHILTMDSNNPIAESLLIQGQYIVAVGSADSVRQQASRQTRVIDLGGQTLMPGFVDAHSHFPSSGLPHAGIDLSPEPSRAGRSIAQLMAHISDAADRQPAHQWIVGFNYDDAALLEGRHPTRSELDSVAPDHPVYLWHRSGHMGVANSIALKELGFSDTSSEPVLASGGQVGRDKQGRLNGLLQEHAAPDLARLLWELPKRRLLGVLSNARDEYLQAGVTTVQNGYADVLSMQLLRWAQRIGVLHQRVVVWPGHDKLPATWLRDDQLTTQKLRALLNLSAADQPPADNHAFTVSAIKLIVDGSPQGRTAWLSKPYLNDGLLKAGYRGLASIPLDELTNLVQRYHRAGLQLALHGNGDAAIDTIIQALEKAQLEHPRNDVRHFVVHAQTIRRDQLEKLAKLDVGVSFFPAHTYYWGDWYRTRVIGEERAHRISPLAMADELAVRYSIHSDAPVTPMQPMHMLWSAINRRTLSDIQLGGDLVVSRMRALRAMTIDAAWQNHIDADRGSLEAGKLADFISLSANPLSVDDVRDIVVSRVWIGGVERYRRSKTR